MFKIIFPWDFFFFYIVVGLKTFYSHWSQIRFGSCRGEVVEDEGVGNLGGNVRRGTAKPQKVRNGGREYQGEKEENNNMRAL